jgi:hypothetical protein
MKKNFYLLLLILLAAPYTACSDTSSNPNPNYSDSTYYRWIAIKETTKDYGNRHTCYFSGVKTREEKILLTYRNNSGNIVEVTDSLRAIKIYDSLQSYYNPTEPFAGITIENGDLAGPCECGYYSYSCYINYRLIRLEKEMVIVRKYNDNVD